MLPRTILWFPKLRDCLPLSLSKTFETSNWSSFHLGQETSRVLPADTSAYTIEGLRSGTDYIIGVSALIGSREGSPATTTVRTGDNELWYWILLWSHALWLRLDSVVFNCPFLFLAAPDQVGVVQNLRVIESRSNVVRVTWVGVPGVTGYRIVWSRRDGKEFSPID